MSTEWDVHCMDCNEGLGFDMNHGESQVASLIGDRDKIAALDGSDVELRFWGNYIGPGWFAKHAGHKLVARNEYGGFLGDCHQSYRCGDCGSHLTCNLPGGHDGKHGQVKP